ncbi:hypothetical protein KIN20_011769 [Parelaphostrongylus tenuis]|uniref:Uncharacterized protein n=1 Tax=Parelaphostrongylus tenuis TaxID=148309 RepID=A0AAD5M9Y3_PARTN|nr:hypothetical protein KIN20_011769 [Parelaphostrongylus tenuis]
MSIGSLNISDSEVYVTNSSGIGGPKSLSAEIKEVDVVEPVCHDVNFQGAPVLELVVNIDDRYT